MNTLSIDPGIQGCGVGMFVDGTLLRASYVRSPCTTKDNLPDRVRAMAFAVSAFTRFLLNGSKVDRVVYEWPRVYQGSKQTGDPNDLTKLAGIDAAIGALNREAELFSYEPKEWKGNVNSNETARRILRRLSADERRAFDDIAELEAKLAACEASNKQIKDTSCKQHNTCDGVGIGLKFLGRFERERVFARY